MYALTTLRNKEMPGNTNSCIGLTSNAPFISKTYYFKITLFKPRKKIKLKELTTIFLFHHVIISRLLACCSFHYTRKQMFLNRCKWWIWKPTNTESFYISFFKKDREENEIRWAHFF